MDEITPEKREIIDKINKLKKEKNAVILVHNYQRPEIYEVADHLGDSLGLTIKATETKADTIVFCGVDFMAESAKILNPEKKVLWPQQEAKCPMAQMANPEALKKRVAELKKKFPDLAVVSYVNTSAAVKALSDICCTSSNALKVVESLPNQNILFVPDQNLAKYVQRFTKKNIIPWEGFCYVHHTKFYPELLKQVKEKMSDAEIIVHPECPPEIIDMADHVTSTSGMIKVARESKAKRFLIGTEVGMIYRLQKEVPDKEFFTIPNGGTCIQMKKIFIEDVYDALVKDQYKVEVDEETAIKAKQALQKMIALR
ncbi:MAG: quinolinate synthase NadA [Nanoarchaeota archaeon]|nr:quinolinate synthase NadA [Nanoarchaeota archaeon]MBU1321165.1 quinolinate synthase NadA [Nanoarchaeota archaeon]MBU1596965.1 quinolinate synthase NadA [Nanoarchaeota archaeon]MBU2441517.1 quinolinate synthase NadA [Nanoarchaeota archaeon]